MESDQQIADYTIDNWLNLMKLKESLSKLAYLERENAELKSGQSDLARQVCYLLNEIEACGGGTGGKTLVTFKNIVEMQENNQRLLILVRDLVTLPENSLEIEQTLQEKVKELKELREEYNEYRREKLHTSEMLNEQISALKDEVTNTIQKLSVIQTSNEDFQRKETNISLEVEPQSLNCDKSSKSILQSDLEMIKGIREEINLLKLLTENAVEKISDEQLQVETLTTKLEKAEQLIEKLSCQINASVKREMELCQLASGCEEKAKAQSTNLMVDDTQLNQIVSDLSDSNNQLPVHCVWDRMETQLCKIRSQNLQPFNNCASEENMRQLMEKLKSVGTEKILLEHDVAAKNRNLQETQDELDNITQRNLRLTLKLNDTMDEIRDNEKKEIKLRTIAKKYKDLYSKLKSKDDGRGAELSVKSLEERAVVTASTVSGRATFAVACTETKREHTKEIDDLSSQLPSKNKKTRKHPRDSDISTDVEDFALKKVSPTEDEVPNYAFEVELDENGDASNHTSVVGDVDSLWTMSLLSDPQIGLFNNESK